MGLVVLFYGQVQGVGFRYKVTQIAKNFSYFGYVKNLPTGTVELRIEGGSRDDLLGFVHAICKELADFIERYEVREAPAHGYTQFSVAR
tara:strand:- start:162 stop:428 length:267 start_codon:yes stop_codon:yes gene_type:complete